MGIDVQFRAENGSVLAEVGDEKFVLSRAASSGALSDTRLLRYLVPWGDAIFNQAQSGDLSIDVQEIISESKNEQLKEIMRNISALVDRLSNETHCYLWFVGD